jgi:hypothetical protein
MPAGTFAVTKLNATKLPSATVDTLAVKLTKELLSLNANVGDIARTSPAILSLRSLITKVLSPSSA